MNIAIKAFSVSEISKYISDKFSSDEILCDVFIEGEISNFKHHSSGHLYFSLKDENAKINCVMFKNSAFYLRFNPNDGDSVRIRGRVGVYEKNGNYQVYVNVMEKSGLGELYEEYVRFLSSLKEKGYFDKERKKSIPFLPRRAALITSPTGAAVRDMISVISRRCPITQIIVCPVSVQGKDSSKTIASMIETVNEFAVADVILLARGGGSIEELWAFNETVVADSIYYSKIPIITGIGHETDFTVSDFTADMRAPTPSAAAELCVPDIRDLNFTLAGLKESLTESVNSVFENYKSVLTKQVKKSFSAGAFSDFITQRKRINALSRLLCTHPFHKTQLCVERLSALEKLIDSMSFENVLKRGYYIAEKNGKIVTEINAKQSVDFITACKRIKTQVNAIETRDENEQGNV